VTLRRPRGRRGRCPRRFLLRLVARATLLRLLSPAGATQSLRGLRRTGRGARSGLPDVPSELRSLVPSFRPSPAGGVHVAHRNGNRWGRKRQGAKSACQAGSSRDRRTGRETHGTAGRRGAGARQRPRPRSPEVHARSARYFRAKRPGQHPRTGHRLCGLASLRENISPVSVSSVMV
jgi:hypothetical protein